MLVLLAGPPVLGGQTPDTLSTRPSATAPCVACLAVQVDAGAAEGLAEAPHGALGGLTVLVALGHDDPLPVELLNRLAQTGALPGILLAPSDRGDAAVLAIRTRATAIRAALPATRIVLDIATIDRDVVDRVTPYLDAAIGSGAAGLPEWTRGPDLTEASVAALVRASLSGGGAVVVGPWRSGDWARLAEFVARRGFGSEIVAERPLTADEIVARHQIQRKRQASLVQQTIADGDTTLLFEVPGFVAPVIVTAETTIYAAPGLVEMEQRNIRVNGAAIAGGSASTPPRLPLLEPERVSTPPLAIALGDAYRYRLDGREPTEGRLAYVVTFEPVIPDASLPHGRAWIDARTFALLRLVAVQTGLRGAIVSSEQHDRYAPFLMGADEVWLPVRTNVFQSYEGAGHRTPIHRTLNLPRYRINPADFAARRAAAHSSPHLMLRETPDGLRYLLRSARQNAESVRAVAPRAGERIRAVAFGVLIDPNITRPLPFAGINYVDLNLFDTGAQLNAFFGGTYGQLSFSVPSLGGTRWQASGRAFAIAARYNDRSFVAGAEQYHENITQRPAHASMGVLRPFARRARARLAYELDYTAFGRADTTAAGFVVPVNAAVHGLQAAIEVERGPWSARAWWNPAMRQRWRPWGMAAARVDEGRTFQRYGGTVGRTLALGPAIGSRVEMAWMDGADLDRFSRYSFNAFENRLHGYPTAAVRFDRGVVSRTVTSWSGRGWRLDGFADMAVVRDPGFGARARGYPGVGAAVEAGGPFRTLWSVEWGYGFRARRDDGRLGTQAVRVTGYRLF
jgi:hypothetical protein